MMNKKILAIGAVGLFAAGVLGLGSATVFAYQGDYTKKGPNYTAERETAMQKIMTSNDFEGWKKLMTADGRNPGVLRKIDTKEEFTKFAESYKLGKAGKVAEANAIRSELGLGTGGGQGRGSRNGGQGQRGQNNGGNFTDTNKNGVCDSAE